MLVVAVPESRPGERRVALTPDSAGRLVAAGWSARIQAGAGRAAGFRDEDYLARDVQVAGGAGTALAGADVVVVVAPPAGELVAALPAGTAVVGLLDPAGSAPLLRELADRGLTAFAMERIPRISRAQSMDALSSQSMVAGYRAVLMAADRLPRMFPMSMTAAGTVPPAKVFVLGAGVAGLQAIATARRLGAVVEAYDVRTSAREEVASLGASFVELPLETMDGTGGYAREQSETYLREQRGLLGRHVAAADVVVTTAAIPGRPAPVLVTEAMLRGMRPGSVVVDLAAESGGNVEVSRPGADVAVGDVTVIGVRNVASDLAGPASALYARNVSNLLLLMTRDGAFAPDFADEVVSGCCVVRDGVVAK